MISSTLLAAMIASSAVAQNPPRKPRIVYPTPVLQPLVPRAEWTSTVTNIDLWLHVPQEDHVIGDAIVWWKLWSAWHPKAPPPAVNFNEEMLLVFTARGPNVPGARLYLNGGHLFGTVSRTVMGGPGFGYRIVAVPRAGVATVFGKSVVRPLAGVPAESARLAGSTREE